MKHPPVFLSSSMARSSSLHADFCVDALEEAQDCYGKPAIFNTDQGAQFTSEAFTTVLLDAEIKINMNGNCLTKPNHPWSDEDQKTVRGTVCPRNGQVERMNRTLKDATVKREPLPASRTVT